MLMGIKFSNVKTPLMAFIMFCVIILSLTVMYFLDKIAIRHTKDQFKQAYGSYNEALRKTVDDLGGETGCFYSASNNYQTQYMGCENFYKKFASNLNVKKLCLNNALSDGCVGKYKEYTSKPACAGFSESMIDRFNQVYVMGDRTSIIIFNYPTGIQKPMFAMDVNGVIGPNKTGYDLFSLVIMRNNKGQYYFYPDITYCLPSSKSGIRYITDIIK